MITIYGGGNVIISVAHAAAAMVTLNICQAFNFDYSGVVCANYELKAAYFMGFYIILHLIIL